MESVQSSTANRPAPQQSDDPLFEDVGKKVDAFRPESDANSEDAETDGQGGQRLVDEIESLCMSCQENGTTRMLLTRIPYFREIILMSFSCPHCGFQNSEVQSAGQIQENGVQFRFILSEAPDLQRQLVKSDTCVVRFEEMDVEIPAGRGRLTNVEGLLTMLVEDLELEQPARRSLNPEAYAKIEEIIQRGKKMLAGEDFPFTMALDDPAGNSWIEPSRHDNERKLTRTQYKRTLEQNHALALVDASGEAAGDLNDQVQPSVEQDFQSEIVPDEVYSFPAACPGCTRPCTTHMKMVDIPHFKEVVIMSTVCDKCGYRSNEVKTGGAIPSQGRRITLKVQNSRDLTRDILKSESCALSSPELDLSVEPGTLGGRFSTVEGLLTNVRDDLRAQIFDVGSDGRQGGDSLPAETKRTWEEFFEKLDKAIGGQMGFTLVLQDPWAASYVQNLRAPDPDPQLTIEDYERTEQENEDLGLKDINVEGYSAEDPNIRRGEQGGAQTNTGGAEAAERSDHDR